MFGNEHREPTSLQWGLHAYSRKVVCIAWRTLASLSHIQQSVQPLFLCGISHSVKTLLAVTSDEIRSTSITSGYYKDAPAASTVGRRGCGRLCTGCDAGCGCRSASNLLATVTLQNRLEQLCYKCTGSIRWPFASAARYILAVPATFPAAHSFARLSSAAHHPNTLTHSNQ